MGFLSDLLDFELNTFGDMIQDVGDDPERLLLGAADPLGTEIWSGITGEDWDPIVNEWGGPTEERYQSARQAGIDTGAGETSHGIAQLIASFYAGDWASGATGGATDYAQNLGGLFSGVGKDARAASMDTGYSDLMSRLNSTISGNKNQINPYATIITPNGVRYG